MHDLWHQLFGNIFSINVNLMKISLYLFSKIYLLKVFFIFNCSEESHQNPQLFPVKCIIYDMHKMHVNLSLGYIIMKYQNTFGRHATCTFTLNILVSVPNNLHIHFALSTDWILLCGPMMTSPRIPSIYNFDITGHETGIPR